MADSHRNAWQFHSGMGGSFAPDFPSVVAGTETKPKFNKKNTLSVDIGTITTKEEKDIAQNAISGEKEITLHKIYIGLGAIILGIILFILGLKDIINFELTTKLFNAKLLNSSPGAFLILIGAVIIIFSNNKIKKK